jgi:hypothetical protein
MAINKLFFLLPGGAFWNLAALIPEKNGAETGRQRRCLSRGYEGQTASPISSWRSLANRGFAPANPRLSSGAKVGFRLILAFAKTTQSATVFEIKSGAADQSSMSEKLEVRRSKIYGRGCFALVHFPKRRKIAAYEGELIRGKRRIQARVDGQEVVKVIWINDHVAIDGDVGGNQTAFINHSCEPNAYMRSAPGNKVIFFALRDIEKGEEITIDYRDPEHPEVCRCGASRCRSKARRS